MILRQSGIRSRRRSNEKKTHKILQHPNEIKRDELRLMQFQYTQLQTPTSNFIPDWSSNTAARGGRPMDRILSDCWQCGGTWCSNWGKDNQS